LPFPIAPSPSRTSPLSYSLARSLICAQHRSLILDNAHLNKQHTMCAALKGEKDCGQKFAP
jgi:hypothetical protein